jgi:hypothetical protein
MIRVPEPSGAKLSTASSDESTFTAPEDATNTAQHSA